MVRPGVVFDFILDELEAREPGTIKWQVVSSTGIPLGYRRRTKVREWLEPLRKDWDDCFIPLRVDSTQLAGSIVDVVVASDLCMLRLWLSLCSVVLLYIRTRTKDSLFLTTPQCHTDRTAWLESGCLQDAYGFHHHRNASTIIRCACATMPRIDMATTKNDFILEVGAFNLGDCVIDLAVIIPVEADLALNGQLHRLTSLDHPGDAVVMLHGNRDLRNHQLLSFLLPRLYTAGYGWVKWRIRVTLRRWCIVWLRWYGCLLNKQRTAITAR